MKIPESPPKFPINQLLIPPFDPSELSVLSSKGEYIHWDKLKHLAVPKGLTPKQQWFLIKLARYSIYKKLNFVDKNGNVFRLATPDNVLQKLHEIDRNSISAFQKPTSVLNTQMRDDYLVQSLMEEAITSSQLEGASTTRKIAKEMLLSNRKPRDMSEKMIVNNFRAMQFIQEMKAEPLTLEIILELHRILTKDTLEDKKYAGNLRTSDDIHVWDNTNKILHTPPKAIELTKRLKVLCQFANESNEEKKFFIHPVVKAILLHFMLAYDHPFVDGNGRTARALFYWSMSHQNYWLMEFISISEIIKRASSKYARAYLYTETDDNDVTYFVIHQLDVILEAIKTLYANISKQQQELLEIENLLNKNLFLQNKLNYRQIALIKHALKHPNTQYLIESHRKSHNITYDTARMDLLNLANLNLLIKQQVGKAFVFIVPKDIKKRII